MIKNDSINNYSSVENKEDAKMTPVQQKLYDILLGLFDKKKKKR